MNLATRTKVVETKLHTLTFSQGELEMLKTCVGRTSTSHIMRANNVTQETANNFLVSLYDLLLDAA